MIKIVVIDKDLLTHQIVEVLVPFPCSIISVSKKQDINSEINRHLPDTIFIRTEDDESESLQLLEKLHEEKPHIPIIMLHPKPDYRFAMSAIKHGAYHFLCIPHDFQELPSIIHGLARLILKNSLSGVNENSEELNRIKGESACCSKLKKEIAAAAPSEIPVLILGETGTGKELVAQALHDLSHRNKGPFVPINCAAIPNDLLETELFGCRRGAFTGAVDRLGFFEKSHQGTLFLDEIGELSLPSQAKLLRVLETKTVTPLGSTDIIPANPRFISATNDSIEKKLKDNHFRTDLLFRINTIVIHVPPLRKRKEDIPLLANYFLNKMADPYRKKKISINALEKLSTHQWPGNVRELGNTVERAAVSCEGPIIRPHHISFFNLKL
jgi:DNA-binding NtrC family response regulator